MERANNHYEVAIIGGGITGLSAAWEIERHHKGTRYALLEGSDRWGGKVLTQKFSVDGIGTFIGDAGPESFVTRKPEVWDLVHELDFEDALIVPASETRHTYLLHYGQITRLPLSPVAFLRSPLLTLRGKLRMLLEPLIPARQDNADESLSTFISRRLGVEAADNLIGPILAGIYNTDPSTQSILTTSPIMREMERDHGSIFMGAFARMRTRRKKPGNGIPKPQFITIKDGTERLIQEIVDHLTGDLLLNSHVTDIQPEGSAYRISLVDGRDLVAETVILTSTANIASELLKGSFKSVSKDLASIPHTNIGTMLLAFQDQDIKLDQEIFGLMIPRREGRLIDAITWTSAKIEGSSPSGYQLMRVFFGGASPKLVELPEKEALTNIMEELNDILGIQATPVGVAMARWTQGYPQANVGHLDFVDQLEASLPCGLFLAGSSYRGLAVPDCIAQGRSAARKAIQVVNATREHNS
jgi:oxygen-dependent protoporphyrinogen oxidase